eukprot:UN03411
MILKFLQVLKNIFYSTNMNHFSDEKRVPCDHLCCDASNKICIQSHVRNLFRRFISLSYFYNYCTCRITLISFTEKYSWSAMQNVLDTHNNHFECVCGSLKAFKAKGLLQDLEISTIP